MSFIILASSARTTRFLMRAELSAISAVSFLRILWYSSTWEERGREGEEERGEERGREGEERGREGGNEGRKHQVMNDREREREREGRGK